MMECQKGWFDKPQFQVEENPPICYVSLKFKPLLLEVTSYCTLEEEICSDADSDPVEKAFYGFWDRMF